jgi:hypothetical protein
VAYSFDKYSSDLAPECLHVLEKSYEDARRVLVKDHGSDENFEDILASMIMQEGQKRVRSGLNLKHRWDGDVVALMTIRFYPSETAQAFRAKRDRTGGGTGNAIQSL